jgi:hypothetical protein
MSFKHLHGFLWSWWGNVCHDQGRVTDVRYPGWEAVYIRVVGNGSVKAPLSFTLVVIELFFLNENHIGA